MSQAVAGTLPIGPVQAYWNGVILGSPKTQATIRYNKETVQYGLEDSPVYAGSYKNRETCEVDIVIADLKVDQLRYVYDLANDITTRSVLKTTVYEATEAVVLFYKEELVLTGTVPVAVGQAGIAVTSTVAVLSSELVPYTKTTDWSITDAAAGTIVRQTAGSITDGETVIVHYEQSATAASIFAGGVFTDFEAELRLVHILDTGKRLQFKAPRARHIGASDIAIQVAAEFGGVPMTFHLLADHSEAPGKQLFQWSKEA